ncbi:MAG: hypothetical protein ABIF17_00140 [Patescibacteria group bacterium]
MNEQILQHKPSFVDKKAWIGIGISNGYISVLKGLKKIIENSNYSELIILIADLIDIKYNLRNREHMTKDLFVLSSNIEIPNCKLKITGWEFLYSNKEYLNILDHYKEQFNKDINFKNKVLSLVKENRQGLNKERQTNAAGYVLEEIASAVFFNKHNFTKIGPDQKEKDFDKLIIDFSNLTEKDFDRF